MGSRRNHRQIITNPLVATDVGGLGCQVGGVTQSGRTRSLLGASTFPPFYSFFDIPGGLVLLLLMGGESSRREEEKEKEKV